MKRITLLILIVAILLTAVFLSGCNNEKSIIHSIELYTQPTTVYLQGQDLNLNGAQLLIKYDDNSEHLVTITEDMISGYDKNLLGEQFVVIRYESEIISLPIRIVSPELVGIDIHTLPSKVNYIQGQLFNIDGCKINVDYAGGATQVVDVTEEMCNLSVIDMDVVGTQVVTVSYSVDGVQRTATFNIFIVPKVLQSMEITASPTKEIYYVGETLDLSGGEIFLSYNSGYPERVDMAEFYNDGQGNLDIQWNNTVIANRSVVNLTYHYTDPTTDDGQTIDFTATFDVTVTERDISYVEILNPTSDTAYRYQLLGTPIDLTGLLLRVTYNNGTTEVLNFTGDPETDPMQTQRVSVEGYNSNGIEYIGYQAVNLVFYYSGVRLKTTFELAINLNNKSVSGVRLILPAGTIYDENDMPCFYQDTPVYPFTNTDSGLQGWKYVMLYDNGTESDAEYDLISSMFEGTSVKNGVYFPEVGQQTWYLRYNQIHNIPFEFRIIPKEIEDASIRFLDGYKTYYGFDLNVEGMMLDLQYNNGETESIYVTPSMIQQFSSDVMGEQTIKVGYSNKYTTEQGIEVEATVTLVKKVKDNYSIGFKTLPKTDYIRDEILTLDGVQINIQYDEGESASTEVIEADDLTDDWVMLDTPLIEGAVTFRNSDGWTLTAFHLSSDWAFIEIGTTQVYLSYEGLSSFNNGAGYTVTVTDPVNSIVLQGYFDSVFSGQELPLDDKNIRVNYTSGRYQIVSVTKDMVNYNPRNLLPGPRLLILSYTDPITEEVFTTEATIEVLEKALRRIEIITPPDKTEYLYTVGSSGESLDYTGLEIMFHYNNGTSDIVAVNEENIMDFSFDNFDTSVENEALEVHVVYINYDDIPRENVYEEIFDTFMIAVRDVVVSSLKWVGPGFWPVVTSEEGKDFNMIDSIVGYVIEVTYSDGLIENKAIQQFASQLEVVGYNRNTAIRQNISLVYNQNSEVSLKVEVNVIPRILDSIALIASQNIEVIENNEIDLKEYKLMLNYSNNTQEIISMTQDYIVKSAQNPGGYDKNDTTIGQRQVTISYTQNGVTRTGTYEMIVHAKQLISIGINTLPKIKYIEGEELDLNGGKVALYYDNGSQEELSMTEATTDNFYINRNKFDNNEFSGVAKLQTIYIVFVAAGQEFQTHFDVIMQDRRTPSVVFDSQNTYEFIYGDKQAPAFMIYGYSDFYQEEATTIFGASKLSHVTVKYIDVNEYNTQDPTKDYTVLPSEVGNYYIIISYDADPVGDTRDSIHNSFIYISPTNLVIEKRVVYVAIDGVEKIYGTVNPNYTISIMSEEKYRNPTMINDMPFAYNDDFYSPNFILSPPQQQSYCYDKENNLITSFLIQCNDLTGAPVDVKTSVGSYQLSISLGESYSKNYNIVFIENYFVVRPRDVLVTPMPVSVEYGDRNIVYRYTISARPGDSASGLYGTDMLTGNLSRMQSSNYNVGSYAITKGTLGNPNYNIVFINDTVSDGGANGIYVTINQRKLYIKVNSKVITYGETLPNLTMEDVTLYRNDVCTVTEGALASTDTLEMLLGATGELVFSHNLTPLSNVGKYSLTAEITGVTTGSVIDNYDVHMIQGFIEVKQKAVQVTANSATKIYGDADPVLTYTVTGDLPSGGLQGSIARQQGEYIGTYAIVIGTLSTANPNYIIDFTGASFVITSKALIARIDSGDLTKVFDGKVPSPPPFTVYQMVDGQEMPVSGTVDTSFISVRIMDARRDNGSYNL
ncbi:MAG: MBG domain-containing protein, partial [Clostridia bacterium]|nr:MBG domain-containing protein [Clostridia bacterium]